MTTAQIETFADIGGISSPEIDLKALLRRNVIPAYLSDVGYTSWRRKPHTITTIAGQQGYDLDTDFWQMQLVTLQGVAEPLQYIGEDPEKLLAAEAAATAPQGMPSGYYLGRIAVSGEFRRLMLNCLPFGTGLIRCLYYTGIHFADDTTSVELDQYIPSQFQWGLVESLKKEIFFIRFGIGDPRFVAAETAYRMQVERATDNPELARRNLPVFAR